MGIALSWLAVGFLRLLFSLFSFLFISCIKIYLSNFIFIFFLLPLFSSCFLLGVGTKMAARQFQFSRKKKKKNFPDVAASPQLYLFSSSSSSSSFLLLCVGLRRLFFRFSSTLEGQLSAGIPMHRIAFKILNSNLKKKKKSNEFKDNCISIKLIRELIISYQVRFDSI